MLHAPPPFSTFFEVAIFCVIFVDFGVTFGVPLAPFGLIFGALLAQIGSLLVPCRARFWLFCTLGCSFWFVVGEINLLRQYFAKKYTCIDLASNFLQIFRMQIIFPRPGGGTIAAGNRDRCPKKGRLQKKIVRKGTPLLEPFWPKRSPRGSILEMLFGAIFH